MRPDNESVLRLHVTGDTNARRPLETLPALSTYPAAERGHFKSGSHQIGRGLLLFPAVAFTACGSSSASDVVPPAEPIEVVETIIDGGVLPEAVVTGKITVSEMFAFLAEPDFDSQGNLLDSSGEVAFTRKQLRLFSRGRYDGALSSVKSGFPPAWLKALAARETGDYWTGTAKMYRADTIVSSAGARGVLQLMPPTAREMGLTVNDSIDQRTNRHRNIRAGAKYVDHQWRYARPDRVDALDLEAAVEQMLVDHAAAYNGGAGNRGKKRPQAYGRQVLALAKAFWCYGLDLAALPPVSPASVGLTSNQR